VLNESVILQVRGAFVVFVFTTVRHARAAVLGRRNDIKRCSMALSRRMLPPWCAAASGTGTKYMRVEIPSNTCTFAIANAARADVIARGGIIVRQAGRNVCANKTASPAYVVVALKQGA
jgi:hypothetical protein